MLPKNLSQIEIENFKRTNSICTSAEFFAAVKTGDPAIVDRLNFFSEHQRVRLDCVAAISNKAPNFYAPLIPNCTQRTEDRPATVAAVRELEQHRNEVVSANIPGR